MPSHWTYKTCPPGDDLFQGDIIARTDHVLAILQEIHSYFCDPKYLCFVVLTQSCDLVMRGEVCKARQIGLGVVRALDGVLPDALAELCGTGAPGVYRRDARIAAQQFLERVINQNEQAHGLFYLHPDADVGIAVPAVVMLRVSISLRSREHYQTLKRARCGRLETEFRNKLGWLTGNLYSRVDTPDWADAPGGKDASGELIADLLDGAGSAERNVWVPDSWLQAAKANNIDLPSIARTRVYETLECLAPPPPLTTAIERVRVRTGQVLNDLNDRQLQRLIDLVKADEIGSLLASRAALSIARNVLGPASNQMLAILDQMPTDARLKDSLVAQMAQAVERFKDRRGAREIAPFLNILRDTFLFGPPAIHCACEILEGMLGADFAAHKESLVEKMQAEKMPASVVARLHSLIREVVDEALIEKLTGRLENDGPFKASLKRG